MHSWCSQLLPSQNSIVIFIFPIFVVYNRILKFFEVISFDATGGIIQLYMNFLVEGQVKKMSCYLLSSSKIYQSIFHNLALFISNFINALLNKYLQFYLKIINIHSLKLLCPNIINLSNFVCKILFNFWYQNLIFL